MKFSISKFFKIFFKVLLALLFIAIILLLIVKWTGFMDKRKSNESFAKAWAGEDRQIIFADYKTKNGQPLSFVKVRQPSDQNMDLAVVMVHGSPGSLDAYATYLTNQSLFQSANLYAVDRPGFGFSAFGNAVPSLKVQSDALAEFIQTLPEEKIILVGHSFGCAVISRMAIDYPSLVDGLINIAGTISSDAEPRNWWRKIIDTKLVRFFVPQAFITCNSEMLPLKQELAYFEGKWSELQMPVTIIHGNADWIVSFENLSNIKAEVGTKSNFVFEELPDKGHLILWTMPGEMTSEIVKMIARVRKDLQIDTQ